ncbi:MAG: energy transducer TonB [Prevotella sp.]|nr:energy transducer TonB [Prevotella sp.]
MRKKTMMMLLMALMVSVGMYAQSDKNVYEVVDVMPSFPGGTSGLITWLKDNVKYPKDAEKEKLQGRVLVAFVVEKNGSISNVKIQRSVHPLLDAEAIRVVKMMPRWEPGKHNNKPVRVRFVLPIVFRLS